jgi:hypothetical protein
MAASQARCGRDLTPSFGGDTIASLLGTIGAFLQNS